MAIRWTVRSATRSLPSVVLTGTLLATFLPMQPMPSFSGVLEVPCDGEGPIFVQDLPTTIRGEDCALVGKTVSDGTNSLVIPPIRHAAGVDRMTTDGAYILQVSTRDDGSVDVNDGDPLQSPTGASVSLDLVGHNNSPTACDDPAYAHLGFKESDTHAYWINVEYRPFNLTAAEVEDAMAFGYVSNVASYNNCSLADEVSATQRYEGRTKTRAEWDYNNDSCEGFLSRDAKNVSDWGLIKDTKTLGIACTLSVWAVTHYELTEADVIYDYAHDWFVKMPSPCNSQYDVYSIAAHEAGHVFGLGHVAEDTHGHLTMSTKIESCTRYARTLGKGDVRGLRALY